MGGLVIMPPPFIGIIGIVILRLHCKYVTILSVYELLKMSFKLTCTIFRYILNKTFRYGYINIELYT